MDVAATDELIDAALQAPALEPAYADLVRKAEQLARLSGREPGPAQVLREGGSGGVSPRFWYGTLGVASLSPAPERSLRGLPVGEA